MRTFRASARITVAVVSLLFLAACSSASPKTVASSPNASASALSNGSAAPSCQAIRAAFVKADVAVNSVVDKTDSARRALALGSAPYKILRHCVVTVPGRATKSEVEIDGPTSVAVLTALITASGGDCPELPVGRGYGDHGFLSADAGSFYGIVGTSLVHVGPFFSVPDVEAVARNVVARVK